jgi:hypothetical protein
MSWPLRRWIVAAVASAGFALLTGIPTDIVPTALYQRMTPVVWWDYPVWAVSSVLAGLLAGTYVRAGSKVDRSGNSRSGIAGGLLSFFAVGCPICNKLVVALLGVGGALTYFGPVQPLLGVLGVVLLATSLNFRLRRLQACAPVIRPRTSAATTT